MVGVAALLAAATYVRFYLMMSIGERVVTDLRRAVFDHILALEPGFFEATRTGEVISRLTNDTALLQQVIGYGLSMFVRNPLMMLGAAVMLFVTSWKLAALRAARRAGDAGADPAARPARAAPVARQPGPRRRRLGATSTRRCTRSAPCRPTRTRTRTAPRSARTPRRPTARGVRASARRRLLIALVMLIAFCAVGVILWVGGHDVLAGRMSAGELSAFVFYAVRGRDAAPGTVSEVWGELQRAAGATERLMELLETQPAIRAPAPPAPRPVAPRDRASTRVSFAYPARPGTPALDRFSLRVSPGERVALVGPSGAGKSTVFALLLRFYDPQAGAVRIDGVELREIDPRALRRLIAVVPQEPVIFAASVLDNVRYGRPEASRRRGASAPASRRTRSNSSSACRRAWTRCSASAA